MRPWYAERPPAADLDGALACTWTADVGGGPHTLVPDGCLDLLWIDDGSLWLCGPETTAWTFSLPPGATAVGVRFRPAVAPALLRLDASELRDVRVTLDALWGDRAARELGERVGEATAPASRVDVLADVVRRLLSDAGAGAVDPVAARVADELASPAPRSVGDLARDVGLSERQVHRRCVRAFGYGPAVLARILRVQRFLRSATPDARLADLAAAAGYADQAHLSREVRAIAGSTPRELQRPIGSRPAFVSPATMAS